MYKVEKVYKYIVSEYGSRNMWISDIAKSLHITNKEANTLTIEAGFFGGKRGRSKNVSSYIDNIEVNTIIMGIPDYLLDALWLKKIINYRSEKATDNRILETFLHTQRTLSNNES